MPNNQYDTKRINSIPILEVAKGLNIQVHGKTTICFLHKENTPSLSFDIKRNRWKCFGCGEGGNVINLVEKNTGLVFKDACKWLCDEFGIPVASRGEKIRPQKKHLKIIKENDDMFYVADLEVYNWIIDNAGISDAAKKYIVEQRHFPETIIGEYRIKSCCNNNGLLFKCIQRFGEDRLLKCGVVKTRKNKNNGEEFLGFIWYGEVLLFPYFDRNGSIIYIQARKINADKRCKYIGLNNVETTIYNQPILNKLTEGDELVICEGVTDCISWKLLGKNAVGIIGASGFKPNYVDILKSFRIFIVPDNDAAGQIFANKIINEFLKIGKIVELKPLPSIYKDITDYYINNRNED